MTLTARTVFTARKELVVPVSLPEFTSADPTFLDPFLSWKNDWDDAGIHESDLNKLPEIWKQQQGQLLSPSAITLLCHHSVPQTVLESAVAPQLGSILGSLPGLSLVVVALVTSSEKSDVDYSQGIHLPQFAQLSFVHNIKVVAAVGTAEKWEDAARLFGKAKSSQWVLSEDISGMIKQPWYDKNVSPLTQHIHNRPPIQPDTEVVLSFFVSQHDRPVGDLPHAHMLAQRLKSPAVARGCTYLDPVINPKTISDVVKALQVIPKEVRHLMLNWSGHNKAHAFDPTVLVTASGLTKDTITLQEIIDSVRDLNLPSLLTLTVVLDVCYAEKQTKNLRRVDEAELLVMGSSRQDQESIDDGKYSDALAQRWVDDIHVSWRELMGGLAQESRRWRHPTTALVQQGFSWSAGDPWTRLDPSVFIDKKTRIFVGREHVFNELEDWRVGGKEQFFLLTGDPGIGKSAWLSTLVIRESSNVLASHFCRYDDPESLKPGPWLENFAAQLLDCAESLPGTPSLHELRDECQHLVLRRGSRSVLDVWCLFLGILKRAVAYDGPPKLLVIDALDEAVDVGGSEGAQILKALVKCVTDEFLPKWIKIVATSRTSDQVLAEVESTLPRMRQIKSHDQRNLADLRKYVVSAISDRAGMEDVEPILEASDGNFIYAEQLLKHRERGTLKEMLKPGSIPNGLQELYTAIVNKLFSSSVESRHAQVLLDVIAAAKAPLPKTIFDEAMSLAQVLPSDVDICLKLLRCVIEEDEATGTLRIFHKSVGDFLTRFPRKFETVRVDLKNGNDFLARACAAFWPRPVRTSWFKPAVPTWPEQGSYVDLFTCAHAVAGYGHGLKEVIEAIGGVDAEAGEWYMWQYPPVPGRYTLLWMACERGNLRVVEKLIEAHHSKAIDKPEVRLGRTPLYVASQRGHARVVNYLLSRGNSRSISKKTYNGKTPFMVASTCGHIDVILMLLPKNSTAHWAVGAVDTPDSQGHTPLYAASVNGYLPVVRALLRDGHSNAIGVPNSYGQTALYGASYYGHTSVVQTLMLYGGWDALAVRTPTGQTPIWVASYLGHVNVLKSLLLDGPRDISRPVDTPDISGCTPLWAAVRKNHPQVVRTLLEDGGSAAVDQLWAGDSAVYLASFHGYAETLKLLLTVGNSKCVDTPNSNGLRPISIAARKGHSNVVSLLINEGQTKHVDTPTPSGETPLFLAAAGGHVEVVRLLLTEGRSRAIHTRAMSGETPLSVATLKGHVDVVKVLLEFTMSSGRGSLE